MSKLNKHSAHQDQSEKSLIEQVPQKHKARFVEMLIDLAESKRAKKEAEPYQQQGPTAGNPALYGQSDGTGESQRAGSTQGLVNAQDLTNLARNPSPAKHLEFFNRDGWSLITATQEAIGEFDHPQNIAANEDLCR